jgi:hypothetical protein
LKAITKYKMLHHQRNKYQRERTQNQHLIFKAFYALALDRFTAGGF